MRTCPNCGRLAPDAAMQVGPNCGLSLAADTSESPQAVPATPVYAAPPPTYGPSHGVAYGQPPAAQPTYGAGYGAQGGYPGAYRPGANWQPSSQPERRIWGRIAAVVVVALVLIALVVSVYNQMHVKPIEPISPASANATVTAAIAASNTLLADPLTSNANGWPNDSHCYFAHDGYHDGGGYICYAPIDGQVDGTETVTVSQVAGPDTYGYGLVFRASEGDYYQFVIDSNSKWAFYKSVDEKLTALQPFTVSVAIDGGLNTANTLSVTMSGSTFDCYVNGQKVGTIHDSTYPEGKWGLDASPSASVIFTNYLARSA
jgi:hypothetical protein